MINPAGIESGARRLCMVQNKCYTGHKLTIVLFFHPE